MGMKYAYIVGKTETGYSAWVPDLPVCGVTGRTLEEVRRLIKEAIPFHIEGLRLEGQDVPEPTGIVEYYDAS